MALRGDSTVAAVEGRAGVRRVARWLSVSDAVVLVLAVAGAQALRFGAAPDPNLSDPTTSVLDL